MGDRERKINEDGGDHNLRFVVFAWKLPEVPKLVPTRDRVIRLVVEIPLVFTTLLQPQQAANIKLKHRMQAGASPAEVDIEHISDEDAPHIEFNIAMLQSDESGQ